MVLKPNDVILLAIAIVGMLLTLSATVALLLWVCM
jgi:hypothetical protein